MVKVGHSEERSPQRLVHIGTKKQKQLSFKTTCLDSSPGLPNRWIEHFTVAISTGAAEKWFAGI